MDSYEVFKQLYADVQGLNERVTALERSNEHINLTDEQDEELYNEAKRVVIQAGKASASIIQRNLKIGYARSARLLDIMEMNGVIGPADGARPRKILIDKIDLEAP